MQFLSVTSLADAIAALQEHPGALPVAGGTDVMVQLNQDRIRPDVLLDISRVPELSQWGPADGFVEIGANVTYARLGTEVGDRLPGLVTAARSVGSPQIRNRGTLGGALGTASPLGDAHPPLLAGNALVQVATARGFQHVAAADFYAGAHRPAAGEPALVTAVLVPVPSGPQRFAKVGHRNAMAVPVAAFALSLDPARRRAGCGVGAAVRTPRAAADAAGFLTGELSERGAWDSRRDLPESVVARFAELVAAVADAGGYPRRALAVLARRALLSAWQQYRSQAQEVARCA